jgi:hypothetical protein
MAESGTAVFTNPDDYRAGIGDASMDLVFTDQGEFKGHLTRLKLDNFHIFRSHENIPRIAYITLAPNRTFVSFPLTSSAHVWMESKSNLAISLSIRPANVGISGPRGRATGG